MATQYAVDLVFRSQTQQLDQVANRIRKLERDLGKLKGQNPFEGTERGARGAGNAVERAGNQAKAAAGGFAKLGKAVGGLVSAYALLAAGKFVIGKTAELETQTRSIQVLTGSLEKAKGVISELQQFAGVTPFTSSELIETAKRLKAFGVDTEKLVDTTKRLGDVAGATGADLSGVATAYGQIMAKGRLQGEELLQLQERGINLQDELQKMYGMTGDEFREALEKGKISAEAVELALQKLTNTGGKYADGAIAQSDTLAGKFSTLQDNIENVAKTLGQVLTPAFKAVLNEAISLANKINEVMQTTLLMQNLGGAMSTGQRDKWWQEAGKEAEKIAKLRNNGMRDFPAIRDQLFRDKMRQYGYDSGLFQRPQATVPTTGASSVPDLLGGTGKDKKGSKKAPTGPTGRIIEYLTGDRSHAGYRADHGGSNYHEHLAFETQQQTQLAMKALQAAGIKIGSTTGGRHAPGSYHYSGRAFDVPASQVPVGQEQALSQMVRSVLAKAGFEGSGIGGGSGGHINEILDDYANKLAESFQQGQQLTTEFTRQNELSMAGTEEARRRLEIQYQYQDNEQKIAELMDAGQQKELQALNDKLKAAELQELENELLVQKAQLLESALRPIADENEMLEARLAGTEKELETRRQIAALTNAGMDGAAATGLVQRNQQLTEQVKKLEETEAMWQSLAGTIEGELGRAMSAAITNVITGTGTVEEAFSQMFKNIGKAFIDMATQMIAKALIMKALGILTGGGGGGGMGMGFTPFASGGFVSSPTLAMIGEGGESEYVIPASKMGSAMVSYASGIRGNGVISGAASDNRAFLDSLTTGIGTAVDSASDDPAASTVATRASIRESERFQENRTQILNQQSELERRYERERIEQMASTPGNLNIRYESQVINNVEYVTRDQAERMAAQSALRGRELAIGSLQNSVKTRKRVGMA